VRHDADDDNVGGGEAAMTTGSRSPECCPEDRFDPGRVVGLSPMITYRGVGDDTDCHKPPARDDVPTSIYGGSRLNTITHVLLQRGSICSAARNTLKLVTKLTIFYFTIKTGLDGRASV